MDYGVKQEIGSLLYSSNKNRSYQLIWDILYYTRLLKYVHRTQYKEIRSRLSLAATKKNLTSLCEQDYLKEVKPNIYSAKDKALRILQEAKYEKNLILLPPEPRGTGEINEMNNTDVFIQAVKLKYFHALLYPNFEYLRPDGLLVLKDENRYKLIFLEIESKKPKWETYLETKRKNYLRLAKDINCYRFWLNTAPKLGLSCPAPEHFKFCVYFVCSIYKEYQAGFKFVKSLKDD